ncbi:Uncharacterised protein [Mycobacteroides abscessus]|nr:Uncharacterised protein [Mycobacteroides abscessus]
MAETGTATAIGAEAVIMDVIGTVTEIAADKGIVISAAIVTATVPRARVGSARPHRPAAGRDHHGAAGARPGAGYATSAPAVVGP